MSERHTFASLIIKSDDIQAEIISEVMRPLVGLVQSKGQPISSRPDSHLAPHSTWILSTKNFPVGLNEESSISEHIEWLLDAIDGKKNIMNDLSGSCDLEISCFLSTDSTNCWFDVPHGVVKKLAEQKIDLVFDVYAS